MTTCDWETVVAQPRVQPRRAERRRADLPNLPARAGQPGREPAGPDRT